MEIFGKSLTHLEQALDLRLERQELLSGNIANSDTPGYVPKDIDFSSALAAAEGRGATGGELTPTGSGSAQVTDETTAHAQEQAGTAPGFDGNKVDLDQAMVALAENGMQYGAAATMARKKLALLSYVASDGNS